MNKIIKYTVTRKPTGWHYYARVWNCGWCDFQAKSLFKTMTHIKLRVWAFFTYGPNYKIKYRD